MMNLNNPNYLLIDEVFPDDYFDSDLRNVAEAILLEFDVLNGNNKYQSWIKESKYKQNQENKIIVLQGILKLFDSEPERALSCIEKCELKYKTEKQVIKALKNRIFDMKVERMKEEGENKIKEEEKKVWTFGDACTLIESHFKGVTLDYNITVEKWCSWDKMRKEDIKRKSA